MPEQTIEMNINYSGTRNEVRMRAVKKFSEEEPGKGSKEKASKYHYIVKYINDGTKVVLTRPANLKNGFDFLIRVQGLNFSSKGKRYRDYPKHDEIIDDLKTKRDHDPILYKKLYEFIENIYECNDINEPQIKKLNFHVGYKVEMILCVIRWFFIEQDIRYWNYSGRNMLMDGIPKP